MANTVGPGFADVIGTRSLPGQTQVEYFNKQNSSQPGFSSPQELANFAGTLSGRTDINANNVFDVVATGFTPRAQALDQIKNELNNYQQETFNQQTEPGKRASSTLVDSINSQTSDLNKYLTEYNDLRTKLQGITAPNYAEAYTQLRQTAGVPGFEEQYANLSKQRRELPYTERANTGNAGVATEGQLGAQTSEKDIPLYIQQANALDRLKLAQDFISTSLNLKELDYNASRQAITDAAGLLGNTLEFTRTSVNDLITRQQNEQALAQQAQDFAIQNGIDQPYYQVGNVIYDTATRTPKFVNNSGTIGTVDGKKLYSTPEQFFKDSGLTSFDQIYHVNSTTMADKSAVLDLRQKYPDAGITAKDTFETASSKLQNSRIYQEQVRPPARGGSGGLSPYQVIQTTNSIQDNAKQDPDVNQFTAIRGAFEQARQAVQQNNSAGDIVLMRTIAKITDPSSSVREEEFKTFKDAIGTLPRYGIQLTSQLVGKGQLSNEGRKQLYTQVENIYKQREAAYMNKIDFYQAEANAVGGSIPFYTAPKFDPINFDQPSNNQQQSQSFWSKATNWLFGK